MGKYIDLTGKKFGRLTVISRDENNKYGRTMWNCLCDCGNKTKSKGYKIISGHIKSCGCLSKENAYIMGKSNKTHCLSDNLLYEVWNGIKKRCYNEKDNRYKNYGGRGIIVCNEWKNDFKTFYDWAINNGYQKGLTIDRIDNNGNYEPNNCRFATRKEQQNNLRTNRLIEYNGEIKTLTEWCEHLNLNYAIIWYRLFKAYWSVEKAFETTIKKYKK